MKVFLEFFNHRISKPNLPQNQGCRVNILKRWDYTIVGCVLIQEFAAGHRMNYYSIIHNFVRELNPDFAWPPKINP